MQNAKHNCIGWKQEGAHGAIDAYMRHSSATARLIYVEIKADSVGESAWDQANGGKPQKSFLPHPQRSNLYIVRAKRGPQLARTSSTPPKSRFKRGRHRRCLGCMDLWLTSGTPIVDPWCSQARSHASSVHDDENLFILVPSTESSSRATNVSLTFP
ncbi:hypothetical protein I7I51_08542 [Histoplasma capsulatum]|uniref:Uncharacterized protein n=1 Tax=Ajellomyces capsulatus TaxID=5037 RepID=A0A8A1M124_AJECA|nr:hypothetical protein I7I51_08542 [Histoplasma capsulatum]